MTKQRKSRKPRVFVLNFGRLGDLLGVWEERDGKLWILRMSQLGWVTRRLRVREVSKPKRVRR